MTTEAILLLLRLISGSILIGVLLVLFVVFWREFRAVADEVEAPRRAFGRLLLARETEGVSRMTDRQYPLLPLTSIGRSGSNTVPLDDHFASGEHALIALRDGQWWLEDRKSRNGTLLNGIPVTQPTIVTDGDVITIGNAQLHLELDEHR